MTDIMTAAQTLVKSLQCSGAPAPAQAHAVWVRAEIIDKLDEKGKPTGTLLATGKQELCVSIRPGWISKIRVPETYEGFRVVNVPWPKGS